MKIETKKTNEVKFMDKVKEFFSVLCRNNVTVIKDGREILTAPVIAFIAAAILTNWVLLPVILVTLFCGVEYTVSGEDISKPQTFTFK